MISRKRYQAFARLALRMGIVSLEDMRAALYVRKRTGERIEAILLRTRAVTRELAAYVHDAVRLAQAG